MSSQQRKALLIESRLHKLLEDLELGRVVPKGTILQLVNDARDDGFLVGAAKLPRPIPFKDRR